MFSLDHATKIYRRGRENLYALKDVSLKIDAGEYVGIVGPSGSGKSTLMHIIGLLDLPSSGTVSISGQNVADMSSTAQDTLRRQAIGFVFQQFLLVPTMTAFQNVMFPLYFAGKTTARERAEEILKRVGLEKRMHHLPTQMSGGEMQRTAIARALVNRPAALLADEPTGNLDTQTADDIYKLFEEINREGTTIVMVTHNHELAATFPRMIKIRDGRLESDEKQ